MMPTVQVRMLRLGDDRKFTQGSQLLRRRVKFAVLWSHSRHCTHYHAALLIHVLCSTHCSNKADLHTTKLTSTHGSRKADLHHPCHVQCQLITSVHTIPSPADACLPTGLSSTCSSGARTLSSMPCLCLHLMGAFTVRSSVYLPFYPSG